MIMMTAANNNEELARIAKRSGIDRYRLAELCMCDRSTIDRYFQPPVLRGKPNPSYRPMPDHRLEMLKLRLKK